MDDIVDLDDDSQFPSSQAVQDAEFGNAPGFMDNQTVLPTAVAGSRGGGRSRGRNGASRSSQGVSQSQTAPPHKLRGPNWTEAEMVVLIG